MPKKYSETDIKNYLQILTDTPQHILACTDGLDETRLNATQADEWSVRKIMAHLRACSELWSGSIHAMLASENPVLTYVHPRQWEKKQGYSRLSFVENFEVFKVEREKLLSVLNALPFVGWGRAATFTGKVSSYTVFGETLRMARHELDHCQQLETLTENVKKTLNDS